MQVISQGIANQRPHPLFHFFAPLQARPDARVPRSDPATARQARLHPFVHRGRQLRRAAEGDRAARKYRKIRRDIMTLGARSPIFDPLLQIAATIDLVRRKPL